MLVASKQKFTEMFCASRKINLFVKNHLIYRSFASEYSKTVNLPKTKFSRYLKKAKREEVESGIRKKCMKSLYDWQRENLTGEEFVLHDGPPYANGDVHMGHAANKILKDIILRSRIVNGTRVHYKPGWDCHGLPIELKAKGIDESASDINIRTRSRNFAHQTVEKQRNEFESWGVTADWSNENGIYKTFDPDYIKNQLDIFYSLYERKYAFRDLKPVYWSPSSKTALAEAELEYDNNHVSPSLTFRVKVNGASSIISDNKNVYALVWTTTPWTLTANQAISFNPTFKYVTVKMNDDNENVFVIAESLVSALQQAMPEANIEKLSSFAADELTNCRYIHPIDKTKELPFLASDHVLLDKGTGLVHTAPTHGFDDYKVALKYGLSLDCFVGDEGKFTDKAPSFLQGKEPLADGNELVLNHISEDIINLGQIRHKYPIDWRTKKPVIITSTKQWFIDVASLKNRAVDEIKGVNFYPKDNDSQLIQRVQSRPYWCISRQRVWGTPIPVFYHKETGEVVLSKEIVECLKSHIDTNGTIDFWWTREIDEIIPNEILSSLSLKSSDLVKGKDILDIWFDSGISWSYALSAPKVADLYLEGVDQLTGWFQSSLLTSIASRDIAPYKSIYVHGFAVDEKGQKMSKSLGNVIHPRDIVNEHNTDTLRWWTAAHVIGQSSIPVKKDMIADSSAYVQKCRETLLFLLKYVQNEKFDGSFDMDYDKLSILDKYSLNALMNFHNEAMIASNNYRFSTYVNNIMSFVGSELSPIYLHLIKGDLYCLLKNDYEHIVKTMLAHFVILNKVLWPITPYLVEECWGHYTDKPFYMDVSKVNVDKRWINHSYDELFRTIQKVRAIIADGLDTDSWRLHIELSGNDNDIALLDTLHPLELCKYIQVQSVRLKISNTAQLSIERIKIESDLCERCRCAAIIKDNKICLQCADILKVMNAN